MLKKKKRESCATPFCVNESNYNQKWMPLVAKHCLEKKKNKVLDTQRVKKKKKRKPEVTVVIIIIMRKDEKTLRYPVGKNERSEELYLNKHRYIYICVCIYM